MNAGKRFATAGQLAVLMQEPPYKVELAVEALGIESVFFNRRPHYDEVNIPAIKQYLLQGR